jgi:nucleoside-diphosphate-sugar epimerase
MHVFLSGGTGHTGTAFTKELLSRGQVVTVLARPSSVPKIPSGAAVAPGDALNAPTFENQIGAADTFVHLVGGRASGSLEGTRIPRD